ncbi:MAG: methyltransferase [Campylobacterota bacterium]|nr:methyltransferase [Campylobacterota bacterium]
MNHKTQEEYNELYLKNIEYLKKHHLKVYEKVSSYNQPSIYELFLDSYTQNGETIYFENIKDIKNSKPIYTYNELFRFNSEEKDNSEKFVIVGINIGHKIFQYEKDYNINALLIIEKDIEKFILSMFVLDYYKLAANKFIDICLESDDNKVLLELSRFYYSMFFLNDCIKVVNDTNSKYQNMINDLYSVDHDKLLPFFNNNPITLQECKSNYILIEEFKKTSNIDEKLLLRICDTYKFLYKNQSLFTDKLYKDSIVKMTAYLMSALFKLNYADVGLLCYYYLYYTELLGELTGEHYEAVINILVQSKFTDKQIYFIKIYLDRLKVNTDLNREKIERFNYILKYSTGETVDKSDKNYIVKEFDSYAERFDQYLVNSLKYNVPSIIAKELKKYLNKDNSYSILDLGCGTGLFGSEISEYSDKLDGIDLSSKMLIKAQERGIYSHLLNVDIDDYLENTQSKYDIVNASDVFVYIGKLDNILFNIKKILNTNGFFSFSIELHQTDENYILNKTGRFSHSSKYIDRLCEENNFQIFFKKDAVIRKEYGKDVDGIIYIIKTDESV